jgi:hypothetical protein
MTLAGDQFSEYVDPQESNREGVNAGDYWRPGSGIEAQQPVERIKDGVQIVDNTSNQTAFSDNSAQYLPRYDQGSFNYYAQPAIASGDGSSYGTALQGFKSLIASADRGEASRTPIPDLTNGYQPLAAKYSFNPAPEYKYTPFKVTA